MFLTAASAPFGSAPWRLLRRPWRVCFSGSLSTSKPTATSLTPSSPATACLTAFWKCERTGQPGVVSETTTFTRPPSTGSIERTMPRSTMLWRSSGSMTTLSASRICSWVGIAIYFRKRGASAWIGGARQLGGVDRRGPAAEELQRLLRARAGLGGVGEERQAGVGSEVEPVVGQVEVADDGMVELLDAGVVEADVVRGPAGAERLALCGELADEV